MSHESFYRSQVQNMNRCTGPAPCQCPITGPHQPDNPHCTRNIEAKRQQRRDVFDAKVRTHGYVDRVTGERIYDPDRLGAGSTAGGVRELHGIEAVQREGGGTTLVPTKLRVPAGVVQVCRNHDAACVEVPSGLRCVNCPVGVALPSNDQQEGGHG